MTTAFSGDSDTAYALVIQADGKLVVGGDTNQGSSATGQDFALARCYARPHDRTVCALTSYVRTFLRSRLLVAPRPPAASPGVTRL